MSDDYKTECDKFILHGLIHDITEDNVNYLYLFEDHGGKILFSGDRCSAIVNYDGICSAEQRQILIDLFKNFSESELIHGHIVYGYINLEPITMQLGVKSGNNMYKLKDTYSSIKMWMNNKLLHKKLI